MKGLYDKISFKSSKITTLTYSTSFSLGIRLLDPTIREPIYAIYGFVRLGDEIVDSFHDFNKEVLFDRFVKDVYRSLNERISINPLLNSFQHIVHQYSIDKELIDRFIESMRMDLYKTSYDRHQYEQYILGSAEVVGLMCLKVFCDGDTKRYEELKPYAMALGSAFQKVNFLRDVKADLFTLGRSYFPGIDFENLDHQTKCAIEDDIQRDFDQAKIGIAKLPAKARFGVYLAYVYYTSLFRKIRKKNSSKILEERVRISNANKMFLLCFSYIRFKMIENKK
jgi:phytoene/squalene synthetase